MIFLNTLNHQYTGGQDRQIATSPKACSLNYMVSSRLAWATDVRLCLKKKNAYSIEYFCLLIHIYRSYFIQINHHYITVCYVLGSYWKPVNLKCF